MLVDFGTDDKEIVAASETEFQMPQELNTAMAVQSENASLTN